jgi:hypothetical protein
MPRQNHLYREGATSIFFVPVVVSRFNDATSLDSRYLLQLLCSAEIRLTSTTLVLRKVRGMNGAAR